MDTPAKKARWSTAVSEDFNFLKPILPGKLQNCFLKTIMN